jgi:hypothetical protein
MENISNNNNLNENQKIILTAFLNYKKRGWSVIPIKKYEKVPAINWKKYQTEMASDEEITNWVTNMPDCQIGVVTGKISNLCVVDIEVDASPSDYDILPDNTLIQKSGAAVGIIFFRMFRN